MKNFTSVVFLNTCNDYDVERYNNILYPSLSKIVCKKILVIPKLIKNIKTNNMDIIYDRELINHMPLEYDYKKQHLLKLYVSKCIKTSHYLILDSDIYINKVFDIENFFTKNKISLFIYNGVGHLNNNNKDCHFNWITSAMSVLDIKKEDLNEFIPYGVTPGLFITEEVINLLFFLENKYKNNFCKVFLNHSMGMEYSLYYLFVKSKNLYIEDYNKKHTISAIWYLEDSFSKLHKDSVFWVIQSNTKLKFDTVYNYIKKHGLISI